MSLLRPAVQNRDLKFRLSLRKLQGSGVLRSKGQDILRLALRRPLLDACNRRRAAIAESDLIFLRFVFCELFEVSAELTWRNKPQRFSPDGWRHTWHAEIQELSGLSRDEVRRRIPRFEKLGLIDINHKRTDYSLAFDGLYIRPNPAKVWEIVNRLKPAKKIEREAAGKKKLPKWLPAVTTVVEGPPTPGWLRERELAWRLLYFSNFRAVLPAAIRHKKAGSWSRRHLPDKTKANVPDGHLKFALGMVELFGVDECFGLLTFTDLFDREGNRIVSQAELLKRTKCSPRELRDAIGFFRNTGVYRPFYKKGEKYRVVGKPPRRVPWGAWSFSKFLEFLQFPGSRFEFHHEPLRFVIIPREGHGQDDEQDEETAYANAPSQLNLLNAIGAQAFDKENSTCAAGQIPSAPCSPSSIKEREREAQAPPLSSFCGGNNGIHGQSPRAFINMPPPPAALLQQQGNCQMNRTLPKPLPWNPEISVPAEYFDWVIQSRERHLEREAERLVTIPAPPELVEWEAELKANGRPITRITPLPRVSAYRHELRLAQGLGRFAQGQPRNNELRFPFSQSHMDWIDSQVSLTDPDRHPGESLSQYVARLGTVMALPGVVSDFALPEVMESCARAWEYMNPMLPGLLPGLEESAAQFGARILLPFSSYARSRLPVEAREWIEHISESSKDGGLVAFTKTGKLLLVPETVAFCAVLIDYAWPSNDGEPFTLKLCIRIWKLIRTGEMTAGMVAWAYMMQSARLFSDAEEWLNNAPRNLLINRWERVRAAYRFAMRAKKIDSLERLPSVEVMVNTTNDFEEALGKYTNGKRKKNSLLLRLGFLHRRGYDVKAILPPATFSRLADELREAPWLYKGLRDILPLDAWCGFTAGVIQNLERRAAEEQEKAEARAVIEKDFNEELERRDIAFQERLEQNDARQRGEVYVTPRQARARAMEEAERLLYTPASQRPVLPTGLRDLDQVLGGGIPRPSVTLVAAASGAGKTLFVSQITAELALKGFKVLFFSAEEQKDRPLFRLLINLLDLDARDLEQFVGAAQGAAMLDLLASRVPEKRDALSQLRDVLGSTLIYKRWSTLEQPACEVRNLVQSGFRPALVVLDGLSSVAIDGLDSLACTGSPVVPASITAQMERTITEFAQLSQALDFAALVTVQADKSKASRTNAVTPRMIQCAPNLSAIVGSDVGFIGISSIKEESHEHLRSTQQFLNVRPPYHAKAELIRVRTQFARQRFVT